MVLCPSRTLWRPATLSAAQSARRRWPQDPSIQTSMSHRQMYRQTLSRQHRMLFACPSQHGHVTNDIYGSLRRLTCNGVTAPLDFTTCLQVRPQNLVCPAGAVNGSVALPSCITIDGGQVQGDIDSSQVWRNDMRWGCPYLLANDWPGKL